MWAVLIVILSTASGLHLPRVQIAQIGPDKVAHFGLYAILALLLGWGFSRQDAPWPGWLAGGFILLAGSGFGGLMEGIQAWFVPQRQYEYADMLANTLGIIAGWAAGLFIFK